MKVKEIPTTVQGCTLYEVVKYHDARGFLAELYAGGRYGMIVRQVNWSHSHKNVVRGIHVAPYYKLVTCVRGRIWDVCVDLRTESPTYLKWFYAELTEDNGRQLLIPPNCGHGFMSLTEPSTVAYCMSDLFNPQEERTIDFLDPTLAIDWPKANYIISEKDRRGERVEG